MSLQDGSRNDRGDQQISHAPKAIFTQDRETRSRAVVVVWEDEIENSGWARFIHEEGYDVR
ncbi:MAG: hypothetical protein Rhob2KO_48340 [Rhodopirellula baltica]